jgi:hypothetical protein
MSTKIKNAIAVSRICTADTSAPESNVETLLSAGTSLALANVAICRHSKIALNHKVE